MPSPDSPRNLLDFQRRFSSDDACWQYLVKTRWPDGFICPHDGDREYWFAPSRKLFICLKNKHYVSVTAGTVLHRTKVPLCHWFYAAYLVTTQTPGMSALQFARQTGVSYETAYMMFQKLRAGLVNPDRTPLVGPVEADETYIGGTRTGPGGRGALNKALVVTAVESRGTKEKPASGRVRLRLIPNAGQKELDRFIKDHVRRGGTVTTDGWSGYLGLRALGYGHQVVGSRELTLAHRVFSNLKTWINGTHHGVSKKHLQAYLNEYQFRFNRRKTPMAGFQTALGIGARVPGPTYDDIYEGRWLHPNPPRRNGRQAVALSSG